jgi:ribosomal protection tetracycline resistance protein
MALVRILVDGYSLLHQWLELAPGKPRHSAFAREELISRLTRYHDANGTPVSIIFDGMGEAGRPSGQTPSTPEVEIIYSQAGQSADQLIERAAHRLSAFGEVLVVTDDFAVRDTVESVGGMFSSCLNFTKTVESKLADLERDIQHYNQKERLKFNRSAQL